MKESSNFEWVDLLSKNLNWEPKILKARGEVLGTSTEEEAEVTEVDCGTAKAIKEI